MRTRMCVKLGNPPMFSMSRVGGASSLFVFGLHLRALKWTSIRSLK
jgi:hypothetical protein